MTRRRTLVVVVVAVACLLLLGRIVSGLFIDYQWYARMHASSVWVAHVVNRVLLTGTIAAITTLFVFANLYAVRRSIVSVVLPRRLANVEIGEELPGRYLTGATAAVSVVLGVLLALPPEPWIELAMARYGVPFGYTDPYFDFDLGFFVYWLPLENALYVRTLLVLVGTVFVVAVLYVAVTPSLRWDRTRFRLTAHVRRHLAALTPLFFAVVAWNYRLDAYAVLTHGAGPGGLFTSTDQHFVIPAERMLALLLLAGGVVTAIALWRNQVKTALICVSASLLLLAGYHVSASLVEHAAVGPELAMQQQDYLAVRRQATRAAYGIRRLVSVPPAAAPIRFGSLQAAVPQISVWDPRALTEALTPTRHQGLLADVVGWRWSAVGLLAWGVEYGGEATGEGGGFGAPLGALLPARATAVDEHGGPLRTDLDGRPSPDEVPILPVLVYPGAVGPLVVADSADRIVGPSLDGVGAQLAAAWSAQRLNWLAAQLPEPHPKLVDRRDVAERVHAVAPFFVQGSVIWPVFSADSLYWVVDLYATADMYPLSQHFMLGGDQRSYFQHAATAFVQAYTGRVLLVADSVRDPIAETWVHEFPALFTTRSMLPPALAAATPPAVDAVTAMADAFAAVGGRSSELGAPAAPLQPVVADNADSLMASGEPPCIALRPGDGSATTGEAGVTPLTCATVVPLANGADRVTGLVVGTGGSTRAILWVPIDSAATQWPSAVSRLRQAGDSAVAGRRDASLARGRVRTVLVGDRLAFVQPEYGWRSDAPKTLLAVTALLGDSVHTGLTLADALGADTLAAPVAAAVAVGAEPGAFRARVLALYDTMQSALKRGDLTTFGAAYAELGRLLGRVPEHLPGK
jgi:uncharacterized protein